MRMLSGRMHWLTVGLALLVSAQGFATKQLHGQVSPGGMAGQMPYGMPPGMSGGVMPAGGMMSPDRPMNMVLQGPPPMDVQYASASRTCDTMGGMGGCESCGNTMCGGRGCGLLGRIGGDGCGACGGAGCGACGGGRGRGVLSGMGSGCGACGGAGCNACSSGGRGHGLMGGMGGGCGACGGAGCAACGGSGSCGDAHGCLFSGALLGILGPCAPYSEGGAASQRWFDLYAGTIGWTRTSTIGGFATGQRDPVTGVFATTQAVSTNGVAGPVVLSTSEVDLDKMRFGLELIGALQLGPGASVEARYFGLNNWDVSRSADVVASGSPTLYSSYSLYGTAPPLGFDDTDRSFIHSISYNSQINNGEVNYRRRFQAPFEQAQGSWLAGIRYFDLDERFGFNATGSRNDTFTFDQLRFFNHDTYTRNQLTGFQVGGDYWINVVPGLQVGVEGKGGIFGNHAEVEAQIFSNSIPGAREHLQDGKTAYLSELTASLVYRLSYSWSLKTSYNLLYVDNVALAPENYNTRDLSNALGSGTGAFTVNRFPFIDVDGEVLYQGWSIGGEYLW